jgi:hypothetical protein
MNKTANFKGTHEYHNIVSFCHFGNAAFRFLFGERLSNEESSVFIFGQKETEFEGVFSSVFLRHFLTMPSGDPINTYNRTITGRALYWLHYRAAAKDCRAVFKRFFSSS